MSSDEAFTFHGRWTNDRGDVLVISGRRNGRYRVYTRFEGSGVPILRRIRMKLGITAEVHEDNLDIPLGLGDIGLGLSRDEVGGETVLVPFVIPSVMGGWEDIEGVPWIEQLPVFRRSEM